MIDYHKKNNRPASFRTISSHLKLSSAGSVQHVLSLRKKGYVNGMIAHGIKTVYEMDDGK